MGSKFRHRIAQGSYRSRRGAMLFTAMDIVGSAIIALWLVSPSSMTGQSADNNVASEDRAAATVYIDRSNKGDRFDVTHENSDESDPLRFNKPSDPANAPNSEYRLPVGCEPVFSTARQQLENPLGRCIADIADQTKLAEAF
jgi:hypothetical protein